MFSLVTNPIRYLYFGAYTKYRYCYTHSYEFWYRLIYVCVCVCARASCKYAESYDTEDRRNTLNIQLKYELFFLD